MAKLAQTNAVHVTLHTQNGAKLPKQAHDKLIRLAEELASSNEGLLVNVASE